MFAESAPTILDELAKLGPIATGSAAVVALIVGLATLWQRNRTDKRDQWWKRAQWALDLTLDEDPIRQAVGLRALQYLANSKLAGRDEAAMLEAAWAEPLADEAGTSDTENNNDERGEG